jgi:hypothetical protein
MLRMSPTRRAALIVVLLLLPIVARQQATSAPPAGVHLVPVARGGDQIGDLRIKADSSLFVGSLNNQDQISFVAESAAGGQLFLQADAGRLTPIVVPGGTAPDGLWSKKVVIRSPVSMDQSGDAVFSADVNTGDRLDLGTFRWDHQTGQVRPLALDGMAAVQNLTFALGGGQTPVMNNQGEVALVAAVKNTQGQAQDGVFFLGRDSQIQPLVLPDQDLPDGSQVVSAWLPSLNDAGTVAMVVRPRSATVESLYRWEEGTLRRLPSLSREATRGRHLAGYTGIWINNRNRNVLLSAQIHGLSGTSNSLFLLTEDKEIPVAVPGQVMPGGGRFLTVQPQDPLKYGPSLATGVSAANAAGQHAFLALLEGYTTAAYLMAPDGTLALLLKSGMVTELGKITSVGLGAGRSQGIALNDRGQVALAVRVAGVPDTLALLTPS